MNGPAQDITAAILGNPGSAMEEAILQAAVDRVRAATSANSGEVADEEGADRREYARIIAELDREKADA